jgi:hypothetical protein
MKNFKLFFASLAIVTLGFVNVSGFSASESIAIHSDGDEELISRALAAANPCIAHANTPHNRIKAQVETVGICFVEGDLKRVSFYRVLRCNQQQSPCPRPLVQLIATVDFDCEENITAVQCHPLTGDMPDEMR